MVYITTHSLLELKKQQPSAEKKTINTKGVAYSFGVSIVFLQIWPNACAVQAKSKYNDMVTGVSAVPCGDLCLMSRKMFWRN